MISQRMKLVRMQFHRPGERGVLLIKTFPFLNIIIPYSKRTTVKRISPLLLLSMVLLVSTMGSDHLPVNAQEDGQENPASGNEQEQTTRTLPSRTTEDQETETSLTNVYASVEELRDIEVTVRRGVATLTGGVPTPSDRKAAETIAEKFSHVLYVNNQINVAELQQSTQDPVAEQTLQDEEIQNTLTTILSQIDDLRDISIRVQSGVVHLTGDTDSMEASNQAEELSRNLEGVRYVNNDIQVHPEVTHRFREAFNTAWEKAQTAAIYFPLFLLGLVIFALFFWIARLIINSSWVGGNPAERSIYQNIIRQMVAVVIFIAGLLFVFELFEITTVAGAVLGGAGILGLMFGFAFRDIVENYLASIMLGLQHPFKKNDLIQVGDHQGKVVRMTFRDTVLMTLDGNHVRIPNSTIFKEPNYNYTSNPKRRFQFTIGIGADEDLIDVYRVGREALQETNGVQDEPGPEIVIDRIGDSSVQVEFQGWVDQEQYEWTKVRSEAIRRTKLMLDAEGIEMPEPIYRVRSTRFLDDEQAEKERREKAKRELQEPGMEVKADMEIDQQINDERQESEEQDLLEE